MVLADVRAQYIPAKIAGEIAPCGMDVIGAVLRVGVFKQEGRALDAIIVRLKLFRTPSPRETDFVQVAFFNLGPVFLGNNSAMSVNILFDEVCEQYLLFLLELVKCNPGPAECLHLGQSGGEDVARCFVGDDRLLGLGIVQREAQLAGSFLLHL